MRHGTTNTQPRTYDDVGGQRHAPPAVHLVRDLGPNFLTETCIKVTAFRYETNISEERTIFNLRLYEMASKKMAMVSIH